MSNNKSIFVHFNSIIYWCLCVCVFHPTIWLVYCHCSLISVINNINFIMYDFITSFIWKIESVVTQKLAVEWETKAKHKKNTWKSLNKTIRPISIAIRSIESNLFHCSHHWYANQKQQQNKRVFWSTSDFSADAQLKFYNFSFLVLIALSLLVHRIHSNPFPFSFRLLCMCRSDCVQSLTRFI